MGLFRSLKKGLKKLGKIAKVVAPIAVNFVPGGGFGMTLLKQGLKMGAQRGNASPSSKNRFPVPNAFMQPSATTARALQIHRVSPHRGGRRAAGPYSQRYGMAMRIKEREFNRTRARALRSRGRMRRRVA